MIYLFIGGTHDGERLEVNEGANTHAMVERREPEKLVCFGGEVPPKNLKRELYVKEKMHFYYDGGRRESVVEFFVINGAPCEQVVRQLMNRYQETPRGK